MQLVTPALGSIAVVREHLGAAQAAAASILNDPSGPHRAVITEGIRQAQLAIDELLHTAPSSPFQDLAQARMQVMLGRDNLDRAFWTAGSAHGVNPLPEVRRYARDAFDAFEAAFEIIDND